MTTINKSKPRSGRLETPLGLYIHIPFCARKCSYCDFVSYPIADTDVHLAYVLKVIFELRGKRSIFSDNLSDIAPYADTVYIGGGTPSLVEPGLVTEILDAIYTSYRASDDAEITIEVNPGTVDPGKLLRYRAAGINRLSIGAQSFNEDELAFLGRIHNTSDIEKSVSDAKSAGFSDINIDLMFGIPGQTIESWRGSLEAAAALGPTHISFYSLGIEAGTPLHKSYTQGGFEAIDDVTDREMYHMAKEYLAGQGFSQYEISNSSKPGMESRHNLKYWSMDPYAGFGVSAHSYYGGRRFSNTENLADYLSAEDIGFMTDWVHENTLIDDMSEFIFLGLRCTSGIELSRFQRRFNKNFWELYGRETEKLIGDGLLEHCGDALKLTSLGLDLANTVFREYV